MPENPWTPSSRNHEPAQLMKPVVGPSAWRREELEASRAYVYRLSEAEAGELLDAVDALEARGTELKDAKREDFPLPILGPALEDIRAEVVDGRGFAFIRGMPIEGRSRFQQAAAFWGIGTHIGRAVSQNGKGHLLGHVKNLGGDVTTPTGRGYNSAQQLDFHSDSCDVFGLCCLKTAKSGGQHRIVSSVTLYNEMLARRPDLAEELTFRFYRTRRGELPPGETTPWTRQPGFSVTDGVFSARGISSTVMRAQGMPGVPDLTPTQLEAIGMYKALASELAMDIDFEPGDISLVLNYVALHARSEYEDWPEPERRRHLLRLWLSLDGARPIHADIERDLHDGIIEDGTVLHAPLEAA